MRTAVGEELRGSRLMAGLSLAVVARSVDMSASKVSRIERGRSPSVSLADLAAVASVVGLDLSVRLYPGPRPIRDIGQIRLLGRFRDRVHPDLAFRTEVPVGREGDLRAWDAVIFGPGFRCAVDAETRLVDLQAIDRRIELKRRDSGIEHVILLVADTRLNREALRARGSGALGSFELGGRAVLKALGEGRDPGGSGIVVL